MVVAVVAGPLATSLTCRKSEKAFERWSGGVVPEQMWLEQWAKAQTFE